MYFRTEISCAFGRRVENQEAADRHPAPGRVRRDVTTTRGDAGGRIQAIYALALHRTDESVAALKKLLVDSDPKIREKTEKAIRTGYLMRGNSRGRRMNPDDFPELPQFDDISFSEIDAAALVRMIERTVFVSGASDDKRAHIIGLYLETREDSDQRSLHMVATDGSRLSKADYLFDSEVQLPFTDSILVPKKGMVEVAKFLEPQETVKFGIQDNNLVVKKENETIIVRLLEGEFPEYDDIIRTRDNAKRIPLERQLFLMMLKRMSILSTEEYRSVIFHFVNGKLLITSTNPDIGESKEDMAIQFEADPIEVAFNPRFFIEALNVIDSETVLLDIVDDEKPCMLTGEGEPGFITVIMPMRI